MQGGAVVGGDIDPRFSDGGVWFEDGFSDGFAVEGGSDFIEFGAALGVCFGNAMAGGAGLGFHEFPAFVGFAFHFVEREHDVFNGDFADGFFFFAARFFHFADAFEIHAMFIGEEGEEGFLILVGGGPDVAEAFFDVCGLGPEDGFVIGATGIWLGAPPPRSVVCGLAGVEAGEGSEDFIFKFWVGGGGVFGEEAINDGGVVDELECAQRSITADAINGGEGLLDGVEGDERANGEVWDDDGWVGCGVRAFF